MSKTIRIGSRGSDLALWQAYYVKNQLEQLGCKVEINIIKTQGDQIQHLSFDKMEGKGFFTKEIEAALLANTIDLAVHSHKDLETSSPEGLEIAAVSEREDPRDILLIRKACFLPNTRYCVAENATIGTSSARRRSQLKRLLPRVNVKDLRGNVPTRIQKLRDGQYDAIVLAYAGVLRLELNLSEFEIHAFDPIVFVPCPAQGVLGLQIRTADLETKKIVAQLNHSEVERQINAERKILNFLEGGCQLPLGAYAAETGKIFVSFAKTPDGIAENYAFDFPQNEEEILKIVNTLQA